MEIRGATAIVTGGASGLGAATCERLAEEGARIAILDTDIANGEMLAHRLDALFVPVDVTDDASVARAVDKVAAELGVARILVSCAGVAIVTPTVGEDGAAHDLAAFRRVIDINLNGTFNVLSKFAARLARVEVIGEERGVVINTASVSAFDGLHGQAAYSASKAGVVGMTLPIAREFAPWRIRVVSIAPGPFWTPMVAGLTDELKQAVAGQIPFPKRFGRPEEYARLVRDIIANPMINAETIRIDGAARLG